MLLKYTILYAALRNVIYSSVYVNDEEYGSFLKRDCSITSLGRTTKVRVPNPRLPPRLWWFIFFSSILLSDLGDFTINPPPIPPSDLKTKKQCFLYDFH